MFVYVITIHTLLAFFAFFGGNILSSSPFSSDSEPSTLSYLTSQSLFVPVYKVSLKGEGHTNVIMNVFSSMCTHVHKQLGYNFYENNK